MRDQKVKAEFNLRRLMRPPEEYEKIQKEKEDDYKDEFEHRIGSIVKVNQFFK